MTFQIETPEFGAPTVVVGGGGAGVPFAVALMAARQEVIIIEEEEADAARCRDFLHRFAGKHHKYRVQIGAASEGAVRWIVEPSFGGDGYRDWWLEAIRDVDPQAIFFDAAAALSHGGKYRALAFGVRIIGSVVETARPDVVPTEASGQVIALANLLGKDAVVSHTDGLPAGMLLSSVLQRAANELLLQGSTPWEIDEALKNFGFGSGPFEMQDETGLGSAQALRVRAGDRSDIIGDRMVQEGRLGRHFGVGWYRYPGGGGAVIDPLVEDLICEEARFAGIERRQINPDEIVAGVTGALADEAQRICRCGILTGKDDLQLIARGQFGFAQDDARFMHYMLQRAVS